MPSSAARDREERCLKWRASHACILILCIVPFLAGCIPGFGWGGDDAGGSSFAGGGENAPALNRSYKSSFLSLQMPSFGAPRVQGQLMPDSGPAILTAFSTIESRRPPQPNTPAGFATNPAGGGAFEPAGLPAAQALGNFYSALAALASGKRQTPVTVVHFGDDHIVDDRFAGGLREHLVGRFGAAGRGLMMPGLFPVRGIKVDRGGQWALASAAADARGPFGITGVRMSSAASDAWLRFTSAQGSFDWLEVTFMTGPGRGTAAVSVDGDTKIIPTNTPATNQTSIRIAVKSREIVVRPRGDGEISVLSVAAGTNNPGLTYANLGLPGSTAWTPGKWDAGFAANDFRKLNPDLIILEYGTREGFMDDIDIRQYEARLRILIDQLKIWAPQSSILVIGPPDAARLPAFAGSAGAVVCRSLNSQEIAAYTHAMERSDERLARWHAPPRLDAVRASLRRAATSSGAFFWDWSKYMGGPCSIHAWTSSKPPLAAPDHITLTEAGDERSARALFAELMAGFEAYQRALQAKAQAILASSQTQPSTKAARKKSR